jgi:hypothetical protein
MVVACIALAVALGGTSYAAITLPRNSVGNKQLRSNAVTSAKVRDGALQAQDFARDQLPRGPRGAQGPKGDPASSAGGGTPTRVAYGSRDPVTVGPAIVLGAAFTDLVGLGVPAGTAGYSASSGPIEATGPSRLIAQAEVVILNAAAAVDNVSCRLVLVGTDVRVMGNYVNAQIPAGNGYLPVAVSSGIDVETGSYDVRVQCAGAATMSFHRGNLTAAVASR